LIPRGRGGLAIDTLASSISAMSHKPTVLRPPTTARSRVRAKWSRNCSNSRANRGSSGSATVNIAAEEFFSVEQNARLVMNAERYYRSMFHGRDES
jgi:hypothetical protein